MTPGPISHFEDGPSAQGHIPVGMWEWDFGYQSTMDSQPAGSHTSGLTTGLSTVKLSPHPEGALGTLLLWRPPDQLSRRALNIELPQMYTMCTMHPDPWKRGNFMKQVSTRRRNHQWGRENFMKQVSTGRRNHRITGNSGSLLNTVPQTMSCLIQLIRG